MSGSSGSTESVPEADGLPEGLEDGDQMEVTRAAATLPQAGLQATMLLAPALTQVAAANQIAMTAQSSRSPAQLKSARPAPDGFLASASLRGPLQTAMLPCLPLAVLAKLRASCSSMKHLVDSLTAGTWAAAAEGYIPPCLIPTSAGDSDHCLRVLGVHAKASANLSAGRIVSSHVASCEGWFSSGAASWSPCLNGNSSRYLAVENHSMTRWAAEMNASGELPSSGRPCLSVVDARNGAVIQVCTIGFGLVDKGPWLQKSHDLVMLAGGRTLRPTSEGYLRTEQGPRLRHIHLLDVDSHLQGIRHSMTWDTLSPHCGPVASAMLPLLLWPVSAERIAIIELDHDHLLERCSIYLDGLSPYIMESDQPAENRAGLAAAAWHVTKLSWSPDASHIIVIRRPDPTQGDFDHICHATVHAASDGAVVLMLPACVAALRVEWAPTGSSLACWAINHEHSFLQDIFTHDKVVLSELHSEFRPMLSEWSPGGQWLATVDIFAGLGHIMNSQTGHLAHSWQQPPDIQYSKIWLPSWANDASCCFIPGNSTMLYMADLVRNSLPVRSSAHMSRCGKLMLDSFRPAAPQQAGPSTAGQANNASLGHLEIVSGQFHAIEGPILASNKRLNLAWHPWPINGLIYALLDSVGAGFIINAAQHTVLCFWNGTDISASLRTEMRTLNPDLPVKLESWQKPIWSPEGYRLAVTATNCVAVVSFTNDSTG